MKLVVFSDIHGNRYAFDAFINEYNIFHTYPAAFKSKEDVKQLIQKVLSEQQDKN